MKDILKGELKDKKQVFYFVVQQSAKGMESIFKRKCVPRGSRY